MKRLPDGFSVTLSDWASVAHLAYAVRYDVFVIEQGVPVELEADEFDEHALHALVYEPMQPDFAVATGRLVCLRGEYFNVEVGRIGRLAVRPDYRHRGLGQCLLLALIQAGRQRGLTCFELHAQVAASALYARLGFKATGEIFEEAGIAHVLMVLELTLT